MTATPGMQTFLTPDTAIFGRRVADVMNPPPPCVAASTTCQALIAQLKQSCASCAVVVTSARTPRGIVTEQDIVHRAAFRLSQESTCESIMTTPVHTVQAGDYLYRAVGRMLRLELRHMPVVDERNRICGLLDLHQALIGAAGSTMEYVRRFSQGDEPTGIREIRSAQIDLIGDLLDKGMNAIRIQRLLTHINNDMYVRLVRRRTSLMADQGHGEAPVGFCLLAMGSSSRGENFLHPDQDHGLILEDYPDGEHDRVDAWFRHFAEGLVEDLEAAGFPRDSGHVMCINPLWRKTLSQWEQQTHAWATRPTPISVRLGDILFDARPLAGNLALGEALRLHLIRLSTSAPAFLQAMVREHEGAGVGLGWFDRFVTMGRLSEHRGHINLKHTGTFPLVTAVRQLALLHGIPATGTLERLHALHQDRVISPAGLDSLTLACSVLAELILRHQLRQVREGRTPDYYVHPGELSRYQRRQLKQAMKSIRRLREQARTDISGQIF